MWDPTTKADADFLDQVQNGTEPRFTLGQIEACSVTDLKSKLRWTPLSERRRHHRLTTLYKIRINLLVVDPWSLYLELNPRPGKQNKYEVPNGRR